MVAGNPADQSLLEEIAKHVSYDIQLVVGLRRDICDAVKEFYDKSDSIPEEGEDELLYDNGADLDPFDYYED